MIVGAEVNLAVYPSDEHREVVKKGEERKDREERHKKGIQIEACRCNQQKKDQRQQEGNQEITKKSFSTKSLINAV